MAFEIPRQYGSVYKATIISAIMHCARHGDGIHIFHNNPATKDLIVKVTDFRLLLEWLESYRIDGGKRLAEQVISSLKIWFQVVPPSHSINGATLVIKQQQYIKMNNIISKVAQI